VDFTELEDAGWFSRDEIQKGIKDGGLRLPGLVSIAYRLIEHWFDSDSSTPLKDIISS